MNCTRREIGKMVLGTWPLARLMAAKPNSRWGGVQVGINAPYSYGNNNLSAEETLQNTLQLGLSAVELRTQPVEGFLGAPNAATPGELMRWRLARTADEFKTFRRKYEDGGVAIQILKVDWIQDATDEVADYCFRMAKALGAKALSCEIPQSKTQWLGAIAAKHKMKVGYHGHQATSDPAKFGGPESWDKAMSYSKYNGINLDIGHFVAANNISPIPFMQKHHKRITHIHVKDMKMHSGPAVAFGTGDVPIQEALRLMRQERWRFQACIEFEYRVPEGSTRMEELAKCVEYCRNALE
jgi:sugar phosphate isomerase/epimerase